MKTTLRLTIAAFGLAIFNLSAATLYVSLESTNPVAPYATWETAATNIQHAVDAAKAGDTVLVTNGVYSAGSRDVSMLNTNQEPPQMVSQGASRVVVTNAVRLESVNGPLLTTIEGSRGLSDENGNPTNTIRCVFLGTNAVLSGFTLTNGYSHSYYRGGGGLCESSAVVTNCILTGNSAHAGGGASGGNLYNCILTGNSAFRGGGASGGTLYNCLLRNNEAHSYGTASWSGSGGGALQCTLYNCTVTGNSADFFGGGAYGGTLYNCTVTGNLGRGAAFSTLYNCLVTDNEGGSYGQFFNCTVIGNNGGLSGTAFNSIIYYNSGGNYDDNFGEGATLNNCCTTPLPTNGVGNITGPPLFMDMAAGDFRLREESPCIDAGTNLVGLEIVPTTIFTNDDFQTILVPYTYEPTDMLGNTRFIDGNGDGKVAWDIGAYEFNSFIPPQFTAPPKLTVDGWKLTVTGAHNKWVHVQRSSDLKNWEDCWSGFMGAEGTRECTDGDTGQKAMFYRVVVP